MMTMVPVHVPTVPTHGCKWLRGAAHVRGKSATAQDLKLSSQSKGASRPTEVEVMRAGLMIMSTCLSVLVYLESCM